MDSFIVVLYFFLSIVTLSMSNKKNTAERENIILSAAAAQAEKEISQLTDYQKQAAIYRHDLRHHMNFIQSCLAGNNTQQALEYINEINNNLDNTRITRYCSNEAINLILSSYINKAHDADISTQISLTGIWLWNRGSLKYVLAILMHILLFFSNNLIVIRRLLSFETALSHCFIQEFIAFSKAFARRLHKSVIL